MGLSQQDKIEKHLYLLINVLNITMIERTSIYCVNLTIMVDKTWYNNFYICTYVMHIYIKFRFI